MSVKASATGRTERHGPYVDNEIQDIYIYWPKETIDTHDLMLQEEEVQSVQYWKWNDYCERSRDGDPELVPRSEMYRTDFFPWLGNHIIQKQS